MLFINCARFPTIDPNQHFLRRSQGKHQSFAGQLLWNSQLGTKPSILPLGAPLGANWCRNKLLIDRIHVYGEGTAIVLSGVAFGLFHGNLSQFFYAAFLGCMFAFLYVRTGRILYPILLHAAINLLGGLPLYEEALIKLEKSLTDAEV